MRDMHCHILPAVDDGSQSLEMSLQMLDAARAAGVTSMVCTPHCRSPYFDFDAMWEAFNRFKQAAGGFPLTMGFEVNLPSSLSWAFRNGLPISDSRVQASSCSSSILTVLRRTSTNTSVRSLPFRVWDMT